MMLIIVLVIMFFTGMLCLAASVFVHTKRQMFPEKQNATVVGSSCGTDECKHTLEFESLEGGRMMRADVYTGLGKAKELPIRTSGRLSNKIILDYPVFYSLACMVTLGTVGFVMTTVSLTTLLMLNAGVGSNPIEVRNFVTRM
jgi:hypothetical protein